MKKNRKNALVDIDALLDKALLPRLAKLPDMATEVEIKIIKDWNDGQIKRHQEFLNKIRES